jgi:hypothetical protein
MASESTVSRVARFQTGWISKLQLTDSSKTIANQHQDFYRSWVIIMCS